MNVESYLKRIKSSHLTQVSVENLRQLQSNHLESIVLENLDTVIRREVSLDLNAAYEKIVENKRGGFCFELNNLFGWLLNQLGYTFKFIPCRVYSSMTGKYSLWSHVALIVEFDSGVEYLTDVGFSMNFKYPLKLICKYKFNLF